MGRSFIEPVTYGLETDLPSITLLSARTPDNFIEKNPHISCTRDPVSAQMKRSNVSNQMSRSLAQRWAYSIHNEAYRRTTVHTEAEEVDSANGLRHLSSQVLERITNSEKIMRATKVVFDQPAYFLSLRFETRAGAHNPSEAGDLTQEAARYTRNLPRSFVHGNKGCKDL